MKPGEKFPRSSGIFHLKCGAVAETRRGFVEKYDQFAEVYDSMMGQRDEIAGHLKKLLARHAPCARTLLDLGCGTGSIARYFSKQYQITGIDKSEKMLSIACRKVKGARFLKQDISRLQVKGRYDIILCIFDTINHLCTFREWKNLFSGAYARLSDRGVFIFDINTPRKLELYASWPAYAEIEPGHSSIFEVVKLNEHRFDLNLQVFSKKGKNIYRLHEERIPEAAFPPAKIRAELGRWFERVTMWDPERKRPSSASEEIYFICRNRRAAG